MVYDSWQRDIAWFSILRSEWPLCRTAFEEWFLPENFVGNGQQKKDDCKTLAAKQKVGRCGLAVKFRGSVP